MNDQAQAALEPFLAQLADLLADALAPRLVAKVAAQAASPAAAVAPTRRLLTLDELVAQLPAGKTPKTWKRWIYERSRRGQIPGQHKLGNRLFFDSEQTIAWLTRGGNEGLDVGGEESLDRPPMRADPRLRRSGR